MGNAIIHRASKLLIAVCQNNETKSRFINHMNMSVDDIDWLISELQKYKQRLIDTK